MRAQIRGYRTLAPLLLVAGWTAGALLATPAAAQQVLNAQAGTADLKPDPNDPAVFAAEFEDKKWNRDTVELFRAIKVNRKAYDRVQAKTRHSDQRLVQAAKDMRDLHLTGRQSFEDVVNSTREEIAALKKLASQPTKAGAKSSSSKTSGKSSNRH